MSEVPYETESSVLVVKSDANKSYGENTMSEQERKLTDFYA